MLMPSVHYKNGSDPLRPLPFLFPGFHPEAIPRPSRRKSWRNGKARPMLSQVDNLCSRTHPLVEAEGGVALVLGLEAGERDGGPSPTL